MTLFEFMVSEYKMESWVPIGTVQLNGKQVKKLKSTVNTNPFGDLYTIVYIDSSTGLPIKEEEYSGDNKMFNIISYSFNRVSDPKGTIFTDFLGTSFKKKK